MNSVTNLWLFEEASLSATVFVIILTLWNILWFITDLFHLGLVSWSDVELWLVNDIWLVTYIIINWSHRTASQSGVIVGVAGTREECSTVWLGSIPAIFLFIYYTSKPNYYLACPSLIGQSNPNNSSAVQPSLNKIIILISQCQDYLSTCWQCQGAHSLQFVHQRRGDSDRWPVSPLRCCTPHTGYTCSPRPTYHSSGDSCQPETFESDNDDFSASTSTSWYQLTGSGCWRRSLPLCSHPTLNGRPHCWLMVSKTRPSSHRNSALRSPCSSHMWNLSHCFLSGTKYLNPELRHGDEGSEEAPRTWRTAIIEAEINVVDNIT